jgi:AcrR family transcriptional regulator
LPRPKQRTPELRDQVLRAAVDVIAAEGVAGFTTRRVAAEASTSTPAVYELFGDKAGLVREVFFEGFRLLGHRLTAVAPTADPRHDLVRLVQAFRRFYRQNPVLARVMFSRPFPDFDPGPADDEAGRVVREHIVSRVQRAIDTGAIRGDAVDVAHVLLCLAQGLAAVEVAGWLGTSRASVDRRWTLAVDAVLDGLRPNG